MAEVRAEVRTQAAFELSLEERRVRLAAEDGVAVDVGAGHELAPRSSYVSRSHFRIERRHAHFVLIDTSTNGTFVQTEDRQVRRVHRGEFRLWGEGWLGVGEPLRRGHALRFKLLGDESALDAHR